MAEGTMGTGLTACDRTIVGRQDDRAAGGALGIGPMADPDARNVAQCEAIHGPMLAGRGRPEPLENGRHALVVPVAVDSVAAVELQVGFSERNRAISSSGRSRAACTSATNCSWKAKSRDRSVPGGSSRINRRGSAVIGLV